MRRQNVRRAKLCYMERDRNAPAPPPGHGIVRSSLVGFAAALFALGTTCTLAAQEPKVVVPQGLKMTDEEEIALGRSFGDQWRPVCRSWDWLLWTGT